MTDAYLDSPPLTDEQRAVVEQPWSARVLVTAGAGAGKTHTLVRRLDALCGHEDPEEALEAAEILVLTFSRPPPANCASGLHGTGSVPNGYGPGPSTRGPTKCSSRHIRTATGARSASTHGSPPRPRRSRRGHWRRVTQSRPHTS